MTKKELDRIKQAYNSGLKVQIWFNGYWEDFDIRDYSMYAEPFSENRQYRIVGNDYADIAEKHIAELEKENEWHKQEVDDIYDLIAEDWSIRYFICVMKDKNHVTAIGSCDEGCSGEVSVNLFFEYDDEKYHIDDIVWWKELILPELKESE